MITKIVQPSPIPQAETYFIDGSSNGAEGEFMVQIFINLLIPLFLNPTSGTGCYESSIIISS